MGFDFLVIFLSSRSEAEIPASGRAGCLWRGKSNPPVEDPVYRGGISYSRAIALAIAAKPSSSHPGIRLLLICNNKSHLQIHSHPTPPDEIPLVDVYLPM
jgi:hypothetical protein